jgi:hypothetical protein
MWRRWLSHAHAWMHYKGQASSSHHYAHATAFPIITYDDDDDDDDDPSSCCLLAKKISV